MSFGIVQAEKVTTESGYSLGAGNASSFKNRIINGGQVIDQRNAGASVTASNTSIEVYVTDRWAYRVLAANKMTLQQSTTAPAGFTNSLKVTSSSAYTPGSSEFFDVVQVIEGYNVADFGLGTANAKSFTLSFWVQSSLTGTFGGALLNSGGNRSYPFSYTINSANTWEQKSITIAGDTTGTWLTDSGRGIYLAFCMGAGSSFLGTPNAWASATYLGPTGTTNLVGTSGATWYMTGTQLEVGTVATSFDFRSYGTELSLCQRYYQQVGGAAYSSIAFGINFSGAQVVRGNYIKYTTPMRANPTMAIVGSLVATDRTGFDTAVTGISGSATALESASCYFTKGAVSGSDYYPVQIAVANASTGYLTFSAEY